jgi:predicted phage baseplate assembly protein
MNLPAPRLDDRSFQDLVDDAKRFIQERCPQWTDHNVSDPGVTLVEAFAWMTDLLLYRLNRVPDRLYVKFLDLLGVEMFPPTAAVVDVDIRLSAPATDTVRIPRGTVVATARTVVDEPVSFTTVEDVEVLPAGVRFVGSSTSADEIVDQTSRLGFKTPFAPFADPPVAGDALYVGLDRPVPDHTVVFAVACEPERGHGILPDQPPLEWQAWTDAGWQPCTVARDSTAGFNRTGQVELYVPTGHRLSRTGEREVALVRCCVAPERGPRQYRASPRIEQVTGATIGATTRAVHAQFVEDEVVGESTGVAGQEFVLRHAPVVPSDEPFVVVVSRPPLDDDGGTVGGDDAARALPWEQEVWELRRGFADSGPTDRHVTLDPMTGTIRFGPLVRQPDGSVRCFGAVPPKGSVVRVPRYRVGGGARGNVAAGAISVLRTSIPYVAGVGNRDPARGGVDGETVDEAKTRGPVQLRTRNRAVTVEDFEVLTQEAAPEIRRVRCLCEADGDDPSAVRVLVVPAVAASGAATGLRDLDPRPDTLERIRRYLDDRRLVGTRVRVEPPQYVGVRVRARVLVEERADPSEVRDAALAALNRYFDPLVGGPAGRGWPFGRAARAGDAYGVLQSVAGVDVVEQLDLLSVNLVDGSTDEVQGVVELYANELVLSDGHVVDVVAP